MANSLVPSCGLDCGYSDFLLLITNVFDYLVLVLAIPLAVGVIAFGGFKMMTAGTNSGEREQAKKIIWMAVWGLIIVLASYLIVKAVFHFLVDPKVIPDNFK
ncbi:MAG: pilin [Patescibacteria group bacterium]